MLFTNISSVLFVQLVLTFITLFTQDPDVINCPLPVFQRPPSAERDATLMRPHEEDPTWLTLTRREPAEEVPQSPGSQDYLIPLPSSCSLATVRSDLNSSPSLDSGPAPDCYQMERLMEQQGLVAAAAAASIPPPSASPDNWETSFATAPIDPPPPPVLPPPDASTPLLLPAPDSPTPPPEQVRERLLRPGSVRSRGSPPEVRLQTPPPMVDTIVTPPPPPIIPEDSPPLVTPHDSPPPPIPSSLSSHTPPSVMIPMQSLGNSNSSSNSSKHKRPPHPYHHHRYKNSASSNNSSSSTVSSCNGSSSSSSSAGSGNSSASTLPLDPTSLPAIAPIPPPLQYVNVEVKSRSPDYHDPYVITETREHREISC